MSFILDALRKSESQRRLESVPEVMRVPIAVKRERVPRWAFGVIAVLTLALIAVTLVGWLDRPDSVGRVTAVPVPEAQSLAEIALPAPSLTTATSRAETPIAGGAPEATAVPARSAQTEPASSGAATALPPGQSRALDPAALPSIAALRAAGVAVPELDLQLLVTSRTAASRFVVINGKRYREGERLLEGPELVAVTDEGAVLREAGRDFLLVTD